MVELGDWNIRESFRSEVQKQLSAVIGGGTNITLSRDGNIVIYIDDEGMLTKVFKTIGKSKDKDIVAKAHGRFYFYFKRGRIERDKYHPICAITKKRCEVLMMTRFRMYGTLSKVIEWVSDSMDFVEVNEAFQYGGRLDEDTTGRTGITRRFSNQEREKKVAESGGMDHYG